MKRIAETSWVRDAGRRLWRLVATERQILVRTRGVVRHVHISRDAHVAACLALAMGCGWIAYSTVAYFGLRDTVRQRDAEIVRGEVAYRQLTVDVADSRRHFLAIAGALERNHTQLVGMVGQNRTLRGDLESMRGELLRADRDERDS